MSLVLPGHFLKTYGYIEFMKYYILTFICLLSSITYSQDNQLSNKKETFATTVKYYHQNSQVSTSIINKFCKLIAGIKGFDKKDSALAKRLTRKLEHYENSLVAQSMSIRLEWKFKNPLSVTRLNLLKYFIKNKLDTTIYNHLWAIYYEDLIDSTIARQLGFVKIGSKDNEQVDWRKLRNVDFNSPLLIETVSIHSFDNKASLISGYGRVLLDSCIFYYREILNKYPNESFYLNEYNFILEKYKFQNLMNDDNLEK
jgi:hypothetical protein